MGVLAIISLATPKPTVSDLELCQVTLILADTYLVSKADLCFTQLLRTIRTSLIFIRAKRIRNGVASASFSASHPERASCA